MKKLLFFIAAIIVATVMSTISCSSSHKDHNLWTMIPSDTIIGGTHLEFDQALGVIIIEKEDGSQREPKILFEEGDNIEFFSHDNHHFFKVWLEKNQLRVREEFFPVITWKEVPNDTIIGQSRIQFDKEKYLVSIEDKTNKETIVLNEEDYLGFYPYDGHHYMEIWLQDGLIFVRDSLISPEL